MERGVHSYQAELEFRYSLLRDADLTLQLSLNIINEHIGQAISNFGIFAIRQLITLPLNQNSGYTFRTSIVQQLRDNILELITNEALPPNMRDILVNSCTQSFIAFHDWDLVPFFMDLLKSPYKPFAFPFFKAITLFTQEQHFDQILPFHEFDSQDPLLIENQFSLFCVSADAFPDLLSSNLFPQLLQLVFQLDDFHFNKSIDSLFLLIVHHEIATRPFIPLILQMFHTRLSSPCLEKIKICILTAIKSLQEISAEATKFLSSNSNQFFPLFYSFLQNPEEFPDLYYSARDLLFSLTFFEPISSSNPYVISTIFVMNSSVDHLFEMLISDDYYVRQNGVQLGKIVLGENEPEIDLNEFTVFLFDLISKNPQAEYIRLLPYLVTCLREEIAAFIDQFCQIVENCPCYKSISAGAKALTFHKSEKLAITLVNASTQIFQHDDVNAIFNCVSPSFQLLDFSFVHEFLTTFFDWLVKNDNFSFFVSDTLIKLEKQYLEPFYLTILNQIATIIQTVPSSLFLDQIAQNYDHNAVDLLEQCFFALHYYVSFDVTALPSFVQMSLPWIQQALFPSVQGAALYFVLSFSETNPEAIFELLENVLHNNPSTSCTRALIEFLPSLIDLNPQFVLQFLPSILSCICSSHEVKNLNLKQLKSLQKLLPIDQDQVYRIVSNIPLTFSSPKLVSIVYCFICPQWTEDQLKILISHVSIHDQQSSLVIFKTITKIFLQNPYPVDFVHHVLQRLSQESKLEFMVLYGRIALKYFEALPIPEVYQTMGQSYLECFNETKTISKFIAIICRFLEFGIKNSFPDQLLIPLIELIEFFLGNEAYAISQGCFESLLSLPKIPALSQVHEISQKLCQQ